MRRLVCGSRTWEDRYSITRVLDGLYDADDYRDEAVLIEGGALGADHIALHWGWDKPSRTGYEVEVKTYPASWGTDGRTAGPVRNAWMVRDGKPDEVWAFIDKPLEQSRGTYDTVKRATGAGVTVYVVQKI